MKIDVIPYASAIKNKWIKNKNVVIIDVLRMGSVMLTGLANGAKGFIPTDSVEKAIKISKNMDPDKYLLGGERDTKIINGFTVGNSPLDYTKEMVDGKTIILTTTNGTTAIKASEDANNIFIGAFLNIKALTDILSELKEAVLVCSGTNEQFSMDDGMCAAMIIDNLSKNYPLNLSDLAQTLYQAYQSKNGNLSALLKDCYHLNLLKRNGFEKDVTYCLQTNIFDFVPEIKNSIVINPKSKQKTRS